MTDYLGKIIPVPPDVSDTGFIYIWGDDRNTIGNAMQADVKDWKLLASTCDEEGKNQSRSYFTVTEKEVEEWMQGIPD